MPESNFEIDYGGRERERAREMRDREAGGEVMVPVPYRFQS